MRKILLVKIGLLGLSFFVVPFWTNAATLFIEPASGTFQVGSTFNANLYLDTEGESINAISVRLNFPPEKLQVTNPSSGQSVIGIWSEIPSYNNQIGTMNLVGALPRGIVASRALITTISFRGKSIGDAVVKISDESRILLNDGKGTDVLKDVVSAKFNLVLPPPAGPIVFSATHPEQDRWYKENTATFSWEENDPKIEGYSYVLNQLPTDTPDPISEGKRTSVSYKDFGSGLFYFHIRALRDGQWGGITHYAIHNDTESPAAFPVTVLPAEKTVRRQPIIQFQTSDAFSGLNRYELKLVRLTSGGDSENNKPLFFETQSPFITPKLELGSYDIIVRAVDNAGNLYDSVKNFQIVETLFNFADEGGLLIQGRYTVSWGWVASGGIIILLLLVLCMIAVHRWHRSFDGKLKGKQFPDFLASQLEELKKYRERYGKIALLLLGIGISTGLFLTPVVRAEETLPPPIVSAFSKNISDDEMFYITGITKFLNSSVVLYIQNVSDGSVITRDIMPDERGEWFYQSPTPFKVGEYIMWIQTRLGDLQSPPSAQFNVSVAREAFRLGSSRISYETVYQYISLILFLGIVGMVVYLAVHGGRVHKKRKLFLREVREAEQSVLRGFAVLRRDIQAELALVRKAKMTRELSQAERVQEEKLLKDLAYVEQNVKKEVWDLEHVRLEA